MSEKLHVPEGRRNVPMSFPDMICWPINQPLRGWLISSGTPCRRDVLRLLGVDHERLTFLHQGRRFRLTDVHGKLVEDLIA